MKQTLSIAIALLVCSAGTLLGANSLQWDTSKDRVSAEIESWPVPLLLERVAAVTGWSIFIEPGITNTIPTKFRDRTSGDALQRLLGSLSYALMPDTNAAARLYVFRTSRNQATRAITPTLAALDKGRKGKIENELVVTLKPGEKIEDLAKRLGAKIVGRADDQNTYRLRFDDGKSTEAARSSLQNDSSVASVEDNYYVSRPETPQMLGGAGRPLGLNPTVAADGKYLIVGLLDTSVQGPEAGIAEFLLDEIQVSEPCAGGIGSALTHGTSMASTVLRSVASVNGSGGTTVRILPVNVYGCGESTSTFEIARGIFEAAKAGANPINMSLGSDGDSPFLANTVANAVKNGVRMYAAAGNEPVTTPVYPAAYPGVTAVTAGDRQGNIAPWANHGSFIDVIAPASAAVNFNNQQYVVTGTSTSSAIAAGADAAKADAQRKP